MSNLDELRFRLEFSDDTIRATFEGREIGVLTRSDYDQMAYLLKGVSGQIEDLIDRERRDEVVTLVAKTLGWTERRAFLYVIMAMTWSGVLPNDWSIAEILERI